MASIISQIDSFIFLFLFFPGNNYENEVICPITRPEGPTDDWVLLVVADSKDDTHLVITKQQSNGDQNSQTPPNVNLCEVPPTQMSWREMSLDTMWTCIIDIIHEDMYHWI